MTLLRTARDKGRIVREALQLNIPLYSGEVYELLAGNDLGRLEQYITRLEDTVTCLLREMEIKNER
jgi:hypothetical protein